MKLTNRQVAKALGWKVDGWCDACQGKPHKMLVSPDGQECHSYPVYTTSLDAIVGEINRLKLDLCLTKVADKFTASLGAYRAPWKDYQTADTAPLALCAVLLAHLKKEPQ